MVTVKILIIILSLYMFFKTLYYGIYEIKQNNKTPGISIIVLSIIILIALVLVSVFCV